MFPIEVTDVLLAFPGEVTHLMPSEEEIPEEFWQDDGSWTQRLFADVFFSGVHNLTLVPKPGIQPDVAWRHIRAIMGSFQPKHEHKEAACRFLLDSWFVKATWERGPK